MQAVDFIKVTNLRRVVARRAVDGREHSQKNRAKVAQNSEISQNASRPTEKNGRASDRFKWDATILFGQRQGSPVTAASPPGK
jgi:hypothetical protein